MADTKKEDPPEWKGASKEREAKAQATRKRKTEKRSLQTGLEVQEVGWEFTPNRTGDDVGTGIHSKALKSQIVGPLAKFVREIAQNAIDRRKDGTDTVRLLFRLVELTGSDKSDFLSSIGFDVLEAHLLASEEPRYVEAGARVAKSSTLLVMYCEDRGAQGLGGEEYSHLCNPDDVRNFSALVRSDGRSRQQGVDESGGQHGLGKAVQHESSDIGAVIYHSLPENESERLIGICKLDSHSIGELPNQYHYTGKAAFGHFPILEDTYETRESVRGPEAGRIAEGIGFSERRSDDDTGTSICIPAFAIPGAESNDPEDLVEAIECAAKEWFWPAMEGFVEGGLEISVQSPNDSEPRRVEITEDDHEFHFTTLRPVALSPLTDHVEWSAHLEATPNEEGDIAARSFRSRLPAKAGGGNAESLLIVKQVRADSRYSQKVAVFRGTGMVVEYREMKELSLAEVNYIAAAPTGLAIRRHSPGTNDAWMDRFLASTEPPAHDFFDKLSPKATHRYGKSAVGNALNEWGKALKTALRDVTQIKPDEEEKSSDNLSKLTPFGRTGRKPNPRRGQITVSVSRSRRRQEDQWDVLHRVNAKFKPPQFTHWGGTLEVQLGSELSNAPTRDHLHLQDITVRDGDGHDLLASGRASSEAIDGNVVRIRLARVEATQVDVRMNANRPGDMGMPSDYISPLILWRGTKGGAV